MATVSPADNVLVLLEKSRLLSTKQLERAEARLMTLGPDAGHELLRTLVRDGTITRWQAKELAAGRHSFFLGQYKLFDKLGVGGRGVVYRAQHASFGRTVALKVLAKEFLKKPEAVARFQNEVKVAAALDHPNIVRAYDANCVGRVHFLVMEFVDGRDLSFWLAEHGPLPADWACECIRQGGLGLQHGHEHGMVHRDIKPGNLMVIGKTFEETPVVKLLDMGFARLITEDADSVRITQPGQVFGTPDYMSPEQAQNTFNADIRSDIYSLGCTLFRMLTGQMPFGGSTPLKKLLARTSGPVPRVSHHRPDIDLSLDEVVAKMMARDPDDRYQTPAEVAAALAPFAMGCAPQPTELAPAELQPATRFSDSASQANSSGTNGPEASGLEVSGLGIKADPPEEVEARTVETPGPVAATPAHPRVSSVSDQRAETRETSQGRLPKFLMTAGVGALAGVTAAATLAVAVSWFQLAPRPDWLIADGLWAGALGGWLLFQRR